MSVHVQALEIAELTALVAPAGQALHSLVPVEDLYVPASHTVHTLAVV